MKHREMAHDSVIIYFLVERSALCCFALCYGFGMDGYPAESQQNVVDGNLDDILL